MIRTEGNNVRFHAFKGSTLILNWEGKKNELRVNRPDGSDGTLETGSQAWAPLTLLSANTWYKVRWRITEKGMAVLINDKVIFREVGDKKRYDLSKPAPIKISNGDGLDIKSFRVTQLGVKKASSLFKAVPTNPNGVGMKGPLEFGTVPIPSTQIGKNFSINKSWVLSVDFIATDQIQSNDPRIMFFWSDGRPGKRPIALWLAEGELRASIHNTVDATWQALAYPVPKSVIGKWASAVFSFDAPTKELELYLDGILVARDRCTITQIVDGPLPIFVGGDNPTDRRFQGKLKSLALWNR